MAKKDEHINIDYIQALATTKVKPIKMEDEMKKSFISYAMAVNVSRAIPDVRDGLKPVHRRILYAMGELNLYNDKPYRKCARIVGDVLGKYHPHGDSAVYEALVRLAQDFSIRCPLVDGQGNFGSVDGDPAAAQRYTEARLSKIASEMLREIDKNTVDYYPNFDNTLMQPVVLPSRFPNLLVNGADGIAVGMATNIPPHNLSEVIDGAIAVMENPEITVEDLMKYVPAPDYPTGGIMMGRVGVRNAYKTGKGSILVRAKTEIEEHNGRERIIVTELPYQVNKSKLIASIADMVKDKRIEGISDIRDESDRHGMRIVFELKRDANAQVVLNTLFKHSQLQVSDGIILLALADGEPKILSLKEILTHYNAHQKEVVTRRTKYDLEKAEDRYHIIEGLVIALDNIDRVIAIIKGSADRQTA
ncbi:MAG: DNA gyrase subunit A, partial [Clostridia bacterium]|nr:DNA gyrase subunit A [Clostridia bacterium]